MNTWANKTLAWTREEKTSERTEAATASIWEIRYVRNENENLALECGREDDDGMENGNKS